MCLPYILDCYQWPFGLLIVRFQYAFGTCFHFLPLFTTQIVKHAFEMAYHIRVSLIAGLALTSGCRFLPSRMCIQLVIVAVLLKVLENQPFQPWPRLGIV